MFIFFIYFLSFVITIIFNSFYHLFKFYTINFIIYQYLILQVCYINRYLFLYIAIYTIMDCGITNLLITICILFSLLLYSILNFFQRFFNLFLIKILYLLIAVHQSRIKYFNFLIFFFFQLRIFIIYLLLKFIFNLIQLLLYLLFKFVRVLRDL